MTSKKQRDDFVNECQRTARNSVNLDSACVKVEFRVWIDGNKSNCTSANLKTIAISFPPTETPADLAAENALLRQQLQEMTQKQIITDTEIEILKQKLDSLYVRPHQ